MNLSVAPNDEVTYKLRFESDEVIVVDKPAHLVTQPGKGHESDSLLNGLFAMSELALASSRKARLAAMSESGDKGATAALKLLENPTQFLSSVQVGITSIGMLNGIVGEAAFSDDLAHWLHGLGLAAES